MEHGEGAQHSEQLAARGQKTDDRGQRYRCGSGFPAAILQFDVVAFIILLTAYRLRLTLYVRTHLPTFASHRPSDRD
jgi:hypothetical protein